MFYGESNSSLTKNNVENKNILAREFIKWIDTWKWKRIHHLCDESQRISEGRFTT